MEIIFTKTLQVVSEQEFRNLNANTSFPPIITEDILADFGAAPVLEGEQAVPTTPYQYSFRDGVKKVKKQYFTKYSLGPVFTDNENQTALEQETEYKARIDTQQGTSVRTTRNQLLKDTDWTQVLDAPVDKDAWSIYRQELRDITGQEGFPFNVIWPTQP
jgi:hypothetical protein